MSDIVKMENIQDLIFEIMGFFEAEIFVFNQRRQSQTAKCFYRKRALYAGNYIKKPYCCTDDHCHY